MNSARLRRYRIFTFVGAMLILLHVGISCLLKRGLRFGWCGFLSLPIITYPVDFARVFRGHHCTPAHDSEAITARIANGIASFRAPQPCPHWHESLWTWYLGHRPRHR